MLQYNVFLYHDDPLYLPCNNKNINRKELYDFYYTAITLTTGYKKIIQNQLALGLVIITLSLMLQCQKRKKF